jgi:SSS family solute:Na+ symporter
LSPLLIGLLCYVAMQLAVAVWVSRRIRTEADYLVAGRQLGPIMTTASTFASWFGAETCVGAAGQVYEHGLDAVSSDPFGYGLCLFLFGLFFASPIYKRGLITLADLFRQRFSGSVEKTVAVLIIPSSLLWAGAQVRAFGHVLATGANVDESTGVALAAGVAAFYTFSGGLLADAYTDLVQGVVLIICLLILFVVVIGDLGGVSSTIDVLKHAPTVHHEATPFLVQLNHWAVPVLGSLFAQELVSRILGARSLSVARNSTLVASGIYMVIGCIPVLLGAIAHATMPGLDTERVLSLLAIKHMSQFGFVIFAGALVSAILSTVDSSLLVCGSLVSHNLAPLIWPNLDETKKVRLARACVLGFGIIAFFLARTGESVHGLVELASSFGSAGVCIAVVMGLYTTRGGPKAALASLFAGAGSFLYAEHVLKSEVSFLISLGCAALSYGVIAIWERSPELAASRQSSASNEL